MKDKTKPRVKLPEKKLRRTIEIILSTLKRVMRDCESYTEFKEYINSMWISGSENEK